MDERAVRERLVARGAKPLSDVELLSILLGDLALSEKALDQCGGSLASMAAMTLPELRQLAALGIKRAAPLSAAFELGRRAAAQIAQSQPTIHSDLDVTALFRPLLCDLRHEEFWALCLSSAGHIIDRARISQGGTGATVVDPKLIVKRAVERLAPVILVVHNHPSGSARPSDEDLALTRRLQAAAALFEIELLDHVIIAAGESFSFRKEGLLKREN